METLIEQSHKLAAKVDTEEAYAWLNPREILVLKLAEPSQILRWRPFSLASEFLRHFEVFKVDAETGHCESLHTFNKRCAKSMTARPMYVSFVDHDRQPSRPTELHHLPPGWALSTTGDWLIWQGMGRGWFAASLDGSQTARWKSPSASGHCAWFPHSHKWVEAVEEYRRGEWSIPKIIIRRANDPGFKQVIGTSGLEDGLMIGVTDRQSLLIHHPPGPKG